MRVRKKLIEVEYHSEGVSLGSVEVVVFVTEDRLYIDHNGKGTTEVNEARVFYPHQSRAMAVFAREHGLDVMEES